MEPITTNSAISSIASTTTTSTEETALSSDFETFLRMLTVQVQNQDPLNPVDATDYATQLATFSSVEQQVLTNDLLQSLNASFAGNGLQDASEWLGMEALVRAPVFFNTTPIGVRPDFAAGTDRAELVVFDSFGAEVQRYELDPAEDDSVFWSGFDGEGELLPAGNYEFHVESYQGETLLDTRMAPVYNPIVEVRSFGNAVIFGLSDGTEITEDDIGGLRPPQS